MFQLLKCRSSQLSFASAVPIEGLTGIWRFHRAGTLPLSGGAPWIAISMSAGSLLGAALVGLALAVAPVAFLNAFLGGVLIVAAIKTARH